MTSSISLFSKFFTRSFLLLSLMALPMSGFAEDGVDDDGEGENVKTTVSKTDNDNVAAGEDAAPTTETASASSVVGAGDVEKVKKNGVDTPVSSVHKRVASYMSNIDYRQKAHNARREIGHMWRAFGYFMDEMYALEGDDVDAVARIARSESAESAAKTTKAWASWGASNVYVGGAWTCGKIGEKCSAAATAVRAKYATATASPSKKKKKS